MIRVVGIGGGGHAKVVVEILRLAGGYELAGVLDERGELWGKDVLGVPVLGGDGLLDELPGRGIRHAFIGVGGAGVMRARAVIYERVRSRGFEVVSAVHPASIIAASARTGYGITVMPGAIINAAARLGDNVIVNTGAIVEHDCVIGAHVHVATGARLAGAVEVGSGSFIGVGASVRQCVRIGRNSVIGAGAAVVDDVPDDAVVAGVPAKPIKRVET